MFRYKAHQLTVGLVFSQILLTLRNIQNMTSSLKGRWAEQRAQFAVVMVETKLIGECFGSGHIVNNPSRSCPGGILTLPRSELLRSGL